MTINNEHLFKYSILVSTICQAVKVLHQLMDFIFVISSAFAQPLWTILSAPRSNDSSGWLVKRLLSTFPCAEYIISIDYRVPVLTTFPRLLSPPNDMHLCRARHIGWHCIWASFWGLVTGGCERQKQACPPVSERSHNTAISAGDLVK